MVLLCCARFILLAFSSKRSETVTRFSGASLSFVKHTPAFSPKTSSWLSIRAQGMLLSSPRRGESPSSPLASIRLAKSQARLLVDVTAACAWSPGGQLASASASFAWRKPRYNFRTRSMITVSRQVPATKRWYASAAYFPHPGSSSGRRQFPASYAEDIAIRLEARRFCRPRGAMMLSTQACSAAARSLAVGNALLMCGFRISTCASGGSWQVYCLFSYTQA